MTREQRWIRTQEEGCLRALALATKLKAALPSAVVEYRGELATVRRIRVIVDRHVAGPRAPARKRAERGVR
jgi:hypothetical protein